MKFNTTKHLFVFITLFAIDINLLFAIECDDKLFSAIKKEPFKIGALFEPGDGYQYLAIGGYISTNHRLLQREVEEYIKKPIEKKHWKWGGEIKFWRNSMIEVNETSGKVKELFGKSINGGLFNVSSFWHKYATECGKSLTGKSKVIEFNQNDQHLHDLLEGVTDNLRHSFPNKLIPLITTMSRIYRYRKANFQKPDFIEKEVSENEDREIIKAFFPEKKAGKKSIYLEDLWIAIKFLQLLNEDNSFEFLEKDDQYFKAKLDRIKTFRDKFEEGVDEEWDTLDELLVDLEEMREDRKIRLKAIVDYIGGLFIRLYDLMPDSYKKEFTPQYLGFKLLYPQDIPELTFKCHEQLKKILVATDQKYLEAFPMSRIFVIKMQK